MICENMKSLIKKIDKLLITEMHQWGIPTLRVALGVVFFWFGVLKVIGQTPVVPLIQSTYSFFPPEPFLFILGTLEVVIGLGLILKFGLRAVLLLLWLQMAGTLFTGVLQPSLFFVDQNPFLLTLEGEFVVKNIVLISAGLVIGGFQIRPGHFRPISVK